MAKRHLELKQMLETRRRELASEVKSKRKDIKESCTFGESSRAGDSADRAVRYGPEDVEFGLIQLKSETLNKIKEALIRLEQGEYGNCFECGEEIAEKRLRALPFALRCKSCEEVREEAKKRERLTSNRRY